MIKSCMNCTVNQSRKTVNQSRKTVDQSRKTVKYDSSAACAKATQVTTMQRVRIKVILE